MFFQLIDSRVHNIIGTVYFHITRIEQVHDNASNNSADIIFMHSFLWVSGGGGGGDRSQDGKCI